MAAEDDWRRQGQESYLKGASFKWQEYRAESPDWDHDHCEFCFQKFMDADEPDALRTGWATPYNADATSFRWVCPTCFEDFREEFGFETS